MVGCLRFSRSDPPPPRGEKLFRAAIVTRSAILYYQALGISYYYYVDSVANGHVVMMLQQISLDIYTVQ